MATATKNPKKANLLDPHSIKHLLDESVTEVVTSRGYVEDVRLSNVRLFIGAVIIGIALLAQFYPKKFPENRDFLLVCIGLYVVFNGVLQFISYTKEKNAILFTYPPPDRGTLITSLIVDKINIYVEPSHCRVMIHRQPRERRLKDENELIGRLPLRSSSMMLVQFEMGSFSSTGLIVSSKLPRFSDMYTLTVASADPKSITANKPVHFTKSVTKWFTKDGILVEGLFWKDVERLIDDYNGERKSK